MFGQSLRTQELQRELDAARHTLANLRQENQLLRQTLAIAEFADLREATLDVSDWLKEVTEE